MGSRQTICLSMIVKNEAEVLPRCLRSVRPWIDAYAIVDTGSTDGTQDVIRRELGGIPGRIKRMPHHRTWLDRALKRNYFDFAAHRNEALRMAHYSSADYALLIDADEELRITNGAKTWPTLTHDRYVTTFRVRWGDNLDGRAWHRTLLVNLRHPWRFRWPIHETLHSDDENATAGIIEGIEVPSYSDGARNQDKVKKYLSDAEHLRWLIKREPDEGRHWFYLGQSYAGAGYFMEALRAYERRVEIDDGWDEERWYAMYQRAPLNEMLGARWQDVREMYLHAYAGRPWRAEPLWAAGVLSVDNGEPALGELYLREAASMPRPPDSFLVDETIYHWRALDDWAGALAVLGRKDDCLKVLDTLMQRELPAEHRERVEDNLATALAA